MLVCGAVYPEDRASSTYSTQSCAIFEAEAERGEIRELTVNVPPLDLEDFERLRDTDIAGYQLSQETYHRENVSDGAHGRSQTRL